MGVLDWEYYNSHFPKLSENDFEKFRYGAERKVIKLLPKSFDEYNESEQADIKDCICNVLNYDYVSQKNSGKSSISNDGYSESYVNREQSDSQKDVNSIIDEWIGNLVSWFIAF